MDRIASAEVWDEMLFNFELRPLETVTPWGGVDDRPSLHWFGMTDGWYWLDVGADVLFQYTDQLSQHLGISTTDDPRRAYVDYHVVRLWEDVLDMLPHILEPIPDRVLERVRPGMDAVRWRDELMEQLTADDDIDQLYRATTWIDARWLDVGYLVAGPRIWLWSNGSDVSIRWENRGCQIDGIEVWTAREGTLTMPVATFVDEVRSFDSRLMDSMAGRVALAETAWPRPDIHVDAAALARDHRERTTWLARALERAAHHEPTPWDEVVDAYDRWRG